LSLPMPNPALSTLLVNAKREAREAAVS